MKQGAYTVFVISLRNQIGLVVTLLGAALLEFAALSLENIAYDYATLAVILAVAGGVAELHLAVLVVRMFRRFCALDRLIVMGTIAALPFIVGACAQVNIHGVAIWPFLTYALMAEGIALGCAATWVWRLIRGPRVSGIGKFSSGVQDLGSNPEHLRDYGK